MSKRHNDLPPMAREYLQMPGGQGARPLIQRFHRWLAGAHMAISALQPEDVERFCRQPLRKLVTARTAHVYKKALIGYLTWLYSNDRLTFDPKCLGIRRKRPLPPVALAFLRSLEPTHKPGTCRGYSTTLMHFHEWVADARIELEGLERLDIEDWLLGLNDRGLHPSTRLGMLLQVRCYLRWLAEHDELRGDPDDLIRSRDLPKLPSYLPRPLTPKADVELQQRLEEAGGRQHRGLLLMRHTGLRIGELMGLEYDCLRDDPSGNRFLKVPLGKLNTERLVPVAEKTYRLIRSLQAAGLRPRPYLLINVGGKRPSYGQLNETLRDASDGLEDDKPITSHRLRHTYATTLIAGGMSLVGVMKLLGHRDYRMTLRYTAITQETVGREYFEALSRLEGKYGTTAIPAPVAEPDPIKALMDIVAWTQKNIGHERGEKRIAQALTKRLIRLQNDIQALIGSKQRA